MTQAQEQQISEQRQTIERQRQEIAGLKMDRSKMAEQELHLRRLLDQYQVEEIAQLRAQLQSGASS